MLPDSPSYYKQLITLDKTHKANSGIGLQAVQGGDPWEQGEHKASSWSTPAVCLGFRATHSTQRRGPQRSRGLTGRGHQSQLESAEATGTGGWSPPSDADSLWPARKPNASYNKTQTLYRNLKNSDSQQHRTHSVLHSMKSYESTRKLTHNPGEIIL